MVDLNKSEKMAMDVLERCVDYPWYLPFVLPNDPRSLREIERTLRRGASTPHIAYDKQKIESHALEIQQALDTLNGLSSQDPMGERSPHLTPVSAQDAATIPVSRKGKYPYPFSPTCWGADTPISLPNDKSIACERLIERAFTVDELPSLIEAILSSADGGETIRRLPRGHAQSLIDAIYEACFTFSRPCKHINDVDMSCRLGTGCPRSFALDSKRMP